MATVSQEQQNLTDLRAEEVSYASQLSNIENRILDTLNRKKILAMEEHNLLRKTNDIREREAGLISGLKDDARELAKDMAEYVGAQRRNLPYQEKLVSMQVELEQLEGLGVAHLNNTQRARRNDLVSVINMTKQLQEQRIQFEEIKAAVGSVEEALGLQVGTLASMGSKLKNLVLSPWTAIAGLLALAITKYKDIQDASEEFRKNTGLTTTQTEEIGASLKNVYRDLRPLGVGMQDAAKSAEELYKSMGNTSLVTEENIKYVAEMAKRMGVSETSAAEFVKSMTLVGKSSADIEAMSKNLESIAVESGVSVSQIMSDIADSSEQAYGSLSKNPDAFVRTAVRARQLGLSMKQIADISEGLLDIESSLSAEMEAQILSGKSLNLDQARYYALIGDTEGVTKEILRQVTSLDEFNKMGVLAQQSYAKALGMSRQDLAKMIKSRDDERKLTAQQRKDNAERADKEKTIQSNLTRMASAWKTIVSDVSSVFLPAIEAMEPLFSGMASAVASIHKFFSDNKWLAYTIAGLTGALMIFLKMGPAVQSIKSTWSGVTESFRGASGWWRGKGMPSVPTPTTTGAGAPIGDKSTQALGGMTKFFKEVNPKNLLAGGAAMIMVAGAIWILAKAMQEFSTGVTWEGVGKGIVAMVGLVAAMAAVGFIAMSPIGAGIIAGAIAIGIMAGAMWLLGDALQKIASAGNATKVLGDLAALSAWDLVRVAGALTAMGPALVGVATGMGVLSAIGGIFGANQNAPVPAQKDKTDIVIEKLDKLIEVLENKNFSVQLDGKKMNKQLASAAAY